MKKTVNIEQNQHRMHILVSCVFIALEIFGVVLLCMDKKWTSAIYWTVGFAALDIILMGIYKVKIERPANC